MKKIAKRIDDTIEDGIYTVNEVADKIGITRQQLARWRKGTSEPTAVNLKNFCMLYNISADYILGLEGRENTANCTKYIFLFIANSVMLGLTCSPWHHSYKKECARAHMFALAHSFYRYSPLLTKFTEIRYRDKGAAPRALRASES